MNNFDKLKSLIIKERVTKVSQKDLDKELFYLECNENSIVYVLKCYDELKTKGIKTENKNNALIYYVLGLTDVIPQTKISQTPTTLPDIDYDTDARDSIKNYLVNKYGKDKVSLLGTYNTLKVKGAIKDVVRQVREEMSFDEVNKITKKFDLIKRTDTDAIRNALINSPNAKEHEYITDYASELAFFWATIEIDSELKKWFDENKDIGEAVVQLLGNAKSTGIHAGGIVVSGKDIRSVVPLTYERNEEIWVTQPEMGDVEGAGLIKYDFLGLNTGGDLNRCLKLVNKRHGTNYTMSNIPLDDKTIFDEFQKGNTVSIFQFSTDLVTPNLSKLKSIDSIVDLAIITSIYRPGPLKMSMDREFINRKNGVEPISYLHESLGKHLESTYGIFVFQESVLTAVMDLGGISPSDSVVVLKAMGKKDMEKLGKFKEKFISNCQSKYKISEALATDIWMHIFAFSEYGFNKCLSGDTKIIRSNLETISLNEIKEIDLKKEKLFLKSFDIKTKKVIDDECLEFIESGIQELYEVELANGEVIKCTLNHEFLCSDLKKHKLSEIIDKDLDIVVSETSDYSRQFVKYPDIEKKILQMVEDKKTK